MQLLSLQDGWTGAAGGLQCGQNDLWTSRQRRCHFIYQSHHRHQRRLRHSDGALQVKNPLSCLVHNGICSSSSIFASAGSTNRSSSSEMFSLRSPMKSSGLLFCTVWQGIFTKQKRGKVKCDRQRLRWWSGSADTMFSFTMTNFLLHFIWVFVSCLLHLKCISKLSCKIFFIKCANLNFFNANFLSLTKAEHSANQ